MDLGLEGSAAVVTGGTKGMGRAIAEAFADDGARVAVLARGTEEIEDTLAELRRRGSPDAVGISVDLTDPAAITAAFALQSLASSLGPQMTSFVRLLGDAFDTVPAVRHGHLSREQAAELFLRLAYSHYLVPHQDLEVLLANLRSFAGLTRRSTPVMSN